MTNSIKRVLHFIVFSFSLFFVHSVNSQELETYITTALENNPEIQKFELQYAIATEKVNEVNTLPNTDFSASYFVIEPETRTGTQRFKVSAKQMFPWFGTITSRENYASALAQIDYEAIVIAKRKLVVSVSESYYKLYVNKAKQAVLTENIELLDTYETLALTSVEVGKASAVDVFRLQIRQNELEQLQQVLEYEFLAEQTAFNNLLNRDSAIDVPITESLLMPSEALEITTGNLALHPELLKYDRLFNSVTQSELLNQKESHFSFGFGIDYINIQPDSDITFSKNGQDILMPTVSLSIPIFNKKYKSKTKQNKLQQQEIEFQKQDRLNTLETLLDKAINDRKSARISYNTQVKNLKQAKDAESILVRSYETGTIDFNDVLDIQELQLKFQMNQIESIKSYYLQTTIINYLIQ
ncbi:heavy metal RND efflux outer membrane protein [Algibacter lectus]|uniref:Heavy metal RND efflux outer membrane protein n=1 Tax=Algibacter lectus TaxID=221126 RepID=A0A090WX47_9FLAO|nr:TolC family protein [Algibacter lectus]GAL81521.1 heavy metal RND efflux outer membrane protein [Algibacter lectus]